LVVNRYPEIERMLRELADHTEQVTTNTTEARELRNTLVQLLAERSQRSAAARPMRSPLKSARGWWRRDRPKRARARIDQVEALCVQIEAEVERAWELGQRLSDDGRSRPPAT
jgi:hypothetical protein